MYLISGSDGFFFKLALNFILYIYIFIKEGMRLAHLGRNDSSVLEIQDAHQRTFPDWSIFRIIGHAQNRPG